jgi:hypothetical protein
MLASTLSKLCEAIVRLLARLDGTSRRNGDLPTGGPIASASLSAEFKEKLKETLRSSMKLAF